MADATIDLLASNLFSLHANFKTTASTTSAPLTNAAANDEKGNVSCQRNIADMTNYTQNAVYCGADFVADLGTFLTKFGDVQGSKVVTALNINMTAAGYVTVDITGHNHGANAHAAGLTMGYADVSDFLPHNAAVVSPAHAAEPFYAWDGFGVPNFGIDLGDASPSSASVSFSIDHKDAQDEAGAHLVGKNITPRCELKMDFVGVPASDTAAKLETDFGAHIGDMLTPLVDSVDSSDSNADFDTFSFTAHANPLLASA